MNKVLYLTGILLFAITTTHAQDCNLSENARSYYVRANVAIRGAKNNADYLNAAAEFKKALQYAPDCADIYFNIANCYDKAASSGLLKDMGSYSEAINNFKRYLELKPNAQNKQAVQNKIYELEYKRDQLTEQMLSVDGRSVFFNGKKLNKYEVQNLMRNTDALRLYNKGLSKNNNGHFWIVTGICTIMAGATLEVYVQAYYKGIDGLPYNNPEKQRNEVIAGICIGAGAGLTIIGISQKAISKKYIRDAVDMYNSGGKKTSSTELKFGFTGNGIGLALNF